RRLEPGRLHYLGTHRERLVLEGDGDTLGVLVGGAPFGEEILLWWNFVARTPEEIAEAREQWQQRKHFGEVTAYDGARLDAPALEGRLRAR
ncbi:MAG: pirin-like C-terminal cupin domain-containing protein, partial [Gammaproteobacteria bacterium]|nr:pirin-like C-terminal cupin domain-containing protein [Gammaproteobacteria bacterium]